MFKKITLIMIMAGLLCLNGQFFPGPNPAWAAGNEDNSDYTSTPPFLTAAAPPLVMLVMGRSHKLYYEAYNDTSDLDGDGDLDVGYNPDEIDYYGYFDSYKCYEYDSSNKYFKPTSLSVANAAATNSKACSGANEWSGDLLNYLTMSRMDAMRKVLYGGYRAVDGGDNSDTVLQRVYVPQDAHSWGKEYKDEATNGYDLTEYSPLNMPSSGTRHLFASTTLSANGDPVLRLLQDNSARIWEWVSKESPVADDSLGTPTDYLVRVKVCDPNVGLESNCKLYPGSDGKFGVGFDVYKPIGMLQRYGETEQMLFGLITGSYEKNTAGGVLRKKISLIADEIDADTGKYLTKDNDDFDPGDDEYKANGIIKTIDRFRIKNYDYADYSYAPGWPDAWIVDRSMKTGEFTDWGNPTAEMMYEALRYFSGAGSATSAFTYSGGDDASLGLPLDSWDDPYAASDRWCSQPFMLVISDINPSYDADQLPGAVFADESGSKWAEVTLGADGDKLNVEKELDAISADESISGNYYIGDKGGTYDSSCAPKSLSTLKDVRGLCPEEPTKQGGYYAASLAYFGHQEDISTASNDQNVLTYTVGLASPLPRIEIKLGDPAQTITLVPFAKSVGDTCSGLDILPDQGKFQPTDTIVDFYVESITPTSGSFRINYEDVEQAADHDMDAIARYSYIVLKADGTPAATPAEGAKVAVAVDGGVYSSGCIIQHLGYIISGTTKDGTYLEVRDADTDVDDDLKFDYFLDTPPGEDPGGNWDDDAALPQVASRFFFPGVSATAELLTNPLWYAAKWGSFLDHNLNGKPDLPAEWDENGDGTPDNYFYVQNPLNLEKQLNQAFLAILERATAGTSASVLSASRSGEGATYQSIFYPKYKNVSWVGDVHALLVDAYGQLREDTNSNLVLDLADDLVIVFDSVNPDEVKKYVDSNGDGELTAAEKSGQTPVITDTASVKHLWSASNWLNNLTDSQAVSQKPTYNSTDKYRYIFTFIDDGDMVNNGETVRFSTTAGNDAIIRPYLHLFEPFTSPPAGFNESSAAAAQINFIRGKDQSGMRNRMYDTNNDGTRDATYRLGDIIGSTATLVGTPAENYDLLYADASYRRFWLKYQNRRKVVYVGGNDGMFHAFNAGFFYFDPSIGSYGAWKFDTLPEDPNGETAFDLGAEMWAYIPFNLLPHLYWLTKPNYEHVFYLDLKPKIFDAKIFANDAKHPGGWGTLLVAGMKFGGGKIRTDKDHDGNYESDDQIMKSSYFVMDITDPESAPELLAEISFDDLGFTTSYPGAILVYPDDPFDHEPDTNKENKWYLVLGSGPNGARLKYTNISKSGTLQPGDLMVGKNSGGRARLVSLDTANKFLNVTEVVGWFENGEKIYHDENNNGSYTYTTDPYISVDTINSISDLKDGVSSQQARIYIVDLKALVGGSLKDPDGNDLNGASPVGPYIDETGFDANSQISDFITVDLDLDYATDAMYFGTISENQAVLGGKLRRIVLSDPDSTIFPTSPSSWEGDSTLINMGQPVTTSPSVAMDWKKRTWVFFGTGRFTNNADVADASQQTYYGIKEPWQEIETNYRVDILADTDSDGTYDLNEMTWEEVSPAYLMDVSNTVVFQSGNIKNWDGSTFTTVTDLNSANLTSFMALEEYMDKDPSPPANDPPGGTLYPNGWKLHFSEARERNLGQAALLGDILTFTTYAPDPNACQNEGDSYLYATYYKTGTAFSSSVIGLGTEDELGDGSSYDVLRKQSLGKGLAVSPAMHTGREKGSKAFVQTSTGAILVIEQQNPGAVKSGKTYWLEEE